MLRRVSEVVADCYRRAADAASRAREANDPDSREFWLQTEERWLKVASHFEFSERVNDFVVSRSAVSSYTVREVGPQFWEWAVYGPGDRVLAAGSAKSMVEARVLAFQFIADLAGDQVQ